MARIDIPAGEAEEYQRLWQLAPQVGKAARHYSAAVYSESKLPVRLRELLRMRIALINECHL